MITIKEKYTGFTDRKLFYDTLEEFMQLCIDELDDLDPPEEGKWYIPDVQVIPFNGNTDERVENCVDWIDPQQVIEGNVDIDSIFIDALEEGATSIEFYCRFDIEWDWGDTEPTGEEKTIDFNMKGEEI